MTNLQKTPCGEDDASRKHRIVENCKQEKHERFCICGLVRVPSKLYDSGTETTAKLVVALLPAQNIELTKKCEMQNDLFVCMRLVRVMGNDSFENTYFPN